YPHRPESPHLVMFYQDLKERESGLMAMEAHVARLEKLLGLKVRAKICWVRGSLLGQHGKAHMGIAIGSSETPAANTNLDRHELAHTVLDQLRVAETDPPMFLHEGWA